MKKIYGVLLLIMLLTGLSACAGETDPLAGEGQSNFQYYFGYGGSYGSNIADLESKRLSADIQRKISRSDIQALRGGGNILLVGTVSSKVDIETARAIAVTEYSDDAIINKLHSDSVRNDKQLAEDNIIADKVAKVIAQQKLANVKVCCFNNEIYILYAKATDAKKLDAVLKTTKAIKNVKNIQQVSY
jgi:hypothetical protein